MLCNDIVCVISKLAIGKDYRIDNIYRHKIIPGVNLNIYLKNRNGDSSEIVSLEYVLVRNYQGIERSELRSTSVISSQSLQYIRNHSLVAPLDQNMYTLFDRN